MKSVRIFLSACLVYVIVAACSAMDPAYVVGHGGAGGSETATTSVSGGAGHGGAAGQGGLMDPVPPADAEPTDGSRLKARYWTGDDGSKSYAPGQWYDSQLDLACSPAPVSEREYRCMPVSGISGSPLDMYSDAACSQKLRVTWICSGTKARFAMTIATSGPCGTVVSGPHVYTIGAMVPQSTTLYIKGASSCAAFWPAGYDVYTVGAEVPLSTFVGMTLR